jgi:hypothetical protein
MAKVIHMHLVPGSAADHPVLIINHVKDLPGPVDLRSTPDQGQLRPVIHREILRSGRDGISLGNGPLLPSTRGETKQGAKLLAS